MSVDLLFREGLGPQPGGAVSIVFGATLPPPVIVPAATLHAVTAAPWRRAQRDPTRGVALPWGRAGVVPPRPLAAPWRPLAALGGTVLAPWQASAPVGRALLLPWRIGQGAQTAVGTGWVSGAPTARGMLAPWQTATQRAAVALAEWQGGTPQTVKTRAPWSPPRWTVQPLRAAHRDASSAQRFVLAPWQAGAHLVSYGGPWTPYVPGPVPVVPCYLPDPGNAVLLLFREARAELADLIFTCRRAALVFVPVRRVYMVTNVTSLLRVSDGANIPTLGMSLSLDVDSWAWGFSASIQPSALPLLEPDEDGTPVELAAWVNGTEFRVFPESIGTERTFGQHTLRVQGRGITAVLDAPISPISVFSEADVRTSQQLLAQALPAGWSANFGLEPWLVPGGVWSHQGTPITAAAAIAQAGGGYVQPHRNLQQISVFPLYPVKPWDWGGVSPDIEVPSAYATREGIEWVEMPRYNRVYVSGTVAGVRGRVTRTGTAGDVLAPGVTDPLVTTASAARQRGVPVLAKTGRLAYVTLRLPVAEGTGVIPPGKFVRYTDGPAARLGLARGVSVDVAGAQVWQTLRLETFA